MPAKSRRRRDWRELDTFSEKQPDFEQCLKLHAPRNVRGSLPAGQCGREGLYLPNHVSLV